MMSKYPQQTSKPVTFITSIVPRVAQRDVPLKRGGSGLLFVASMVSAPKRNFCHITVSKRCNQDCLCSRFTLHSLFAEISLRNPWDGIEQGVLRSQKTVMDIVTKLSQCVNVFQTSKLPLFDDRNFTRSGRPPQGWGAFCLR